MSLRLRDLAIAVLGFALAGLMLIAGAISGDIVPGLFLLTVSLLWLLGRARVPEAGGVAGRFALRRARLRVARVAVMFGVYLGIIVALFVGWRDDWHESTEGRVATYALAGLAYLLLREMDRAGDDAARWWHGGRAEVRVRGELEPLRQAGWIVLDDLPKDWGGNIDHVVTGPGGAYAIETKSGATARRDDLRSARINAAWMKPRLGVRWVTPVLCLVSSEAEPHEQDGVSVVGLPHLRA